MGCGSSGNYFCTPCAKELKRSNQICPTCCKPSFDGVTHPKCRNKHSLNRLVSVWEYKGPLRKAFLAMKYRYAYDLGTELADLVANNLTVSKKFLDNTSFVLIPVPTHKKRKNVRGFNQTEIIGKRLSYQMGWEYKDDVLKRVKNTTPQTGLSKKVRMRSQKGAFKVSEGKSILEKNKIILFDDIWTTGATLREAAKVVKRKGTGNVSALVVARTSS